ncbi:hypothetical protein [Nocardia brasiliensis]|uniref:hypothetical protein n=1 Tax=Nocardia brasiliensis TaxID=37326 RepID=UPI0004A71336|nr:hypothetical protein [Nocardia brasiliensis]
MNKRIAGLDEPPVGGTAVEEIVEVDPHPSCGVVPALVAQLLRLFAALFAVDEVGIDYSEDMSSDCISNTHAPGIVRRHVVISLHCCADLGQVIEESNRFFPDEDEHGLA